MWVELGRGRARERRGADAGGGCGPATRAHSFAEGRRLTTGVPAVYPRTTSIVVQARYPDPGRTNVAPGRLYATQCGTGAVPGCRTGPEHARYVRLRKMTGPSAGMPSHHQADRPL